MINFIDSIKMIDPYDLGTNKNLCVFLKQFFIKIV